VEIWRRYCKLSFAVTADVDNTNHNMHIRENKLHSLEQNIHCNILQCMATLERLLIILKIQTLYHLMPLCHSSAQMPVNTNLDLLPAQQSRFLLSMLPETREQCFILYIIFLNNTDTHESSII
jgi:hypothetical protein